MRKLLGITAAIFLGFTLNARAETDYPSRTVTIVVPFSAGGPSDVATRILADELAKIWKQQVVVENKAGGGAVIGNTLVAKSKPDGYTMLMIGPAFVVSPGIRSSLPYDTVKDFSGVSIFVDAPVSIVAHPGFEPNTVPELIEAARKRPDRPFTFGTSGIGTTGHMYAELLQRKMGIRLKHVPYAGDAAGMPDALSGRIDFQIGTWSNERPYVESGKMKLLAIMYRSRLPEVPNVPTLRELYPDIGAQSDAFNGIVVPAMVPADVKAKIAEAMKAVSVSPSFKERIAKIGSYPRFTTPEETDAFIRSEVKTWSEVAKAAGIKVD
jgi:tripartite-type tricarboxylate transporter receptor subunit TctC